MCHFFVAYDWGSFSLVNCLVESSDLTSLMYFLSIQSIDFRQDPSQDIKYQTNNPSRLLDQR